MRRREFILGAGGILSSGARPLWAAGSDMYVVRRGDTLSEIAAEFGTTVGDLKRANGLKGDLIRIGDELAIPVEPKYLDAVKAVTRGIGVERDRWRYIVAHHSGIRNGNAEVYHKYHLRRGMQNGLAYHFVIGNGVDSGDGEIEVGNRWLHQLDGGHVRKHEVNQTGIGICLVGNFEQSRPTRRQMSAFTELVDFLGGDLLGSRYTFTVHKEVDRNHTVCPGRNFPVSAMHRRYG